MCDDIWAKVNGELQISTQLVAVPLLISFKGGLAAVLLHFTKIEEE